MKKILEKFLQKILCLAVQELLAKRILMKKFLAMMILLSLVLAINPPQNGNFPDGFWEKMKEQNIGQTYGDPGWVRKISEQMNGQIRDAQLEFFIPVLLGQYADVPTTYFNASDYDELLFGEKSLNSLNCFERP